MDFPLMNEGFLPSNERQSFQNCGFGLNRIQKTILHLTILTAVILPLSTLVQVENRESKIYLIRVLCRHKQMFV